VVPKELRENKPFSGIFFGTKPPTYLGYSRKNLSVLAATLNSYDPS
jgi:hypothetical protein